MVKRDKNSSSLSKKKKKQKVSHTEPVYRDATTDQRPLISSPNPGPSTYQCDVCTVIFNNSEQLESHKHTVHRDSVLSSCPHCSIQLEYYGILFLSN